MNSHEIVKVVMTLVGKIEPVADSAIDEIRRDNINKLIDVVKDLHQELSDVYSRNESSQYSSVSRLCGDLNDYFNYMGIDN